MMSFISYIFISFIALVHIDEQLETKAVQQVLLELGDTAPQHYIENPSEEQVKRGEELIKIGRTIAPNGKKSKYISKYYTCTSCHNVEREDPDLTLVDQDARLLFAKENDLGYLQGSTFWGAVNRATWYNDDYFLKYGSLVEKARESLEESVQLCAQVCAQGRKLEPWEMESIMAYYWSLEMKMNDLNLSDSDWSTIKNEEVLNQEKIDLIKSRYLQKSPATFAKLPESKAEGYPYEGRADFGKLVYEKGCQHCHRPNGESDVDFDESKLTFRWLKDNITKTGDLSIYQIIRKGTYSEYGHQEYMPHYTLEKMSHQQVEDLRSYIEQRSL